MTALLDRVDTAAITVEARQVRFWVTVLSVVAFLLIGAGKLAYWTLSTLWLVGVWTCVAVRTGWREAKAADQAKRRRSLQAR